MLERTARRRFLAELTAITLGTKSLAASEPETTTVLNYAPPICATCGRQMLFHEPFRLSENVSENHPIRLECGNCKITVEVLPRDLYRAVPARIVARHGT